MAERRPLSKMLAEKFHPHSIRFPDSLWERFVNAALAEGRCDVSALFRECAIVGLDRREFERAFQSSRCTPGNTGVLPARGTGV